MLDKLDNDLNRERGRGYNALFFVVLGAYLLNTIYLAALLWNSTFNMLSALFSASLLLVYLIIFVCDKAAKAAFLLRDLAIARRIEEARKTST